MGQAPAKESIYCVSDIHTDHEENWDIILKMAEKRHLLEEATLICAGDVSTHLDVLRDTLTHLKKIFAHVFFCPGNNELRLSKHDRKAFSSSIEKFHAVLALCEELDSALLGVHVKPHKVYGVWIVPLFAWYTPRFLETWDGDRSYRRRWLDFSACHWPADMDDENGVAEYMLKQNEAAVSRTYDGPVITYSHFLPRRECLPSLTSSLMNASLPLVIGCPALDTQLRQIGSTLHVFGHTHLNLDKTVDGVRYVQNAFGHPTERRGLNLQQLSESIKCIHSAAPG